MAWRTKVRERAKAGVTRATEAQGGRQGGWVPRNSEVHGNQENV